MPRIYTRTTNDERFDARLMAVGECIVWSGAQSDTGYGQFHKRIAGGPMIRISAHRFSYEREFGEIPAGMVIDHLCRNRLCVRISHLEVVTNGENFRRGMAPNFITRRTGICKRGHSMADAYIAPSHGRRRCRVCQAMYNMEVDMKRKAGLMRPSNWSVERWEQQRGAIGA